MGKLIGTAANAMPLPGQRRQTLPAGSQLFNGPSSLSDLRWDSRLYHGYHPFVQTPVIRFLCHCAEWGDQTSSADIWIVLWNHPLSNLCSNQFQNQCHLGPPPCLRKVRELEVGNADKLNVLHRTAPAKTASGFSAVQWTVLLLIFGLGNELRHHWASILPV